MAVNIETYHVGIHTFSVKCKNKYATGRSKVEMAGRQIWSLRLVTMLLMVTGAVELNLGLSVEQE
jgi:hypothetical protein